MQVEELYALRIVVNALGKALVQQKVLTNADIQKHLPHPANPDRPQSLEDKALLKAWDMVNRL